MNKESEKWFAAYLDSHGYSKQFEPELDGNKKPDFLIEKLTDQALCEVKEFETQGIFKDLDFESEEAISRPAFKALRPIRNQIDTAATQLKEYQSLNIPLLVVLSNPLNAQVTLNDQMVISAMFGDPSTVFTISENRETQSTDWVGRNGSLRNNHKHISGIVVLERTSKNQELLEQTIEDAREVNPNLGGLGFMNIYRNLESTLGNDEFTYRCTLYENFSSTCVPVPLTLFNGPNDHRYRPTVGVMSLLY